MKRIAVFFLVCLFCAGALTAHAQVAPSATRGQFSVTVGGLGSFFKPDYGPNNLYGLGAYVDVKFNRWMQAEAEGRWLRFNQVEDIHEDNYLIGPRVPIHRFNFMEATPYAKFLIGMGQITLENNYAYGRFTDLTYGGGVDLKLTRRISLRAVDFEYQQWPNSINGTLSPYGVSAGIGYRVF